MLDWVLLTDPKTSASYYANTRTRVTSWECPPELGGPGNGFEPVFVKLHGGWLQYEDEASGRFYYYNMHTQQCQWSMPAEARPVLSATRETFDAIAVGNADDAGHEEEETDDEDLVDEPDEYTASEPPSPRQDLTQKAADRAARRLKILEEILDSERTYVKSLGILKKVYVLPLRTVADSSVKKGQIFTQHDLDAVFINVDLIMTVNEHFLSELETELAAREGDWRQVQFGEIIKRAAKQFKGIYTRYVSNFETANEHLTKMKASDKEKHRYLEVCKTHPDANKQDVHSFLILPVQRVPRYRMLLEELLRSGPGSRPGLGSGSGSGSGSGQG